MNQAGNYKNNGPRYASDEWVEQVLANDTLTQADHERIASDLGRCGHLRALCQLHIGLCRKQAKAPQPCP